MSNFRIPPLHEDFYNPFDIPEEKSKTPKHISDGGGVMKSRREIFNINRVVYTKRPNGEFTVIAKTQFAKGEIIEICPIIFVGIEAKAIDRIKDFVFEIEKGRMYGLVMGYGSLYKHSGEPNVSYAYNRANRQMYFIAEKTIQAQEELTIDYGKDYWAERTPISTLAPKNETPRIVVDDNNQEIEETAGLGPSGTQLLADRQAKNLANPRNPANPGISGVAPINRE